MKIVVAHDTRIQNTTEPTRGPMNRVNFNRRLTLNRPKFKALSVCKLTDLTSYIPMLFKKHMLTDPIDF